VLKRFEDDTNRFFYYDVKNRFIGSNGHAKSLNTESFYYSLETEEFLNKYVETPFSELLQIIDKIDFNSESFNGPIEIEKLVKRFIYSLIARSPQMISETSNHSLFFLLMNPRDQHDYAAQAGIRLAENNNILQDYFVTFAVNKSQTPFILSMYGLYSFSYNRIPTVILPVSPKIAIMLVHSEGRAFFIKDNVVSMLLITESEKTKF